MTKYQNIFSVDLPLCQKTCLSAFTVCKYIPTGQAPSSISPIRGITKQLVAMVAAVSAPIISHFTGGSRKGLSIHSLLNSRDMSRD